MSHSPGSPHTFRTCAPLTQKELATLDQQQREHVEQVLQGRSEFPDHDKHLFFKPFVVSISKTMKEHFNKWLPLYSAILPAFVETTVFREWMMI
jgi:hypothetical protein